MADSRDEGLTLTEGLVGAAALMMLIDIGHTAYNMFVDRDKVKAKQLEVERELKSNGYEVLGLIVEKANNLSNAVGNVLDAAPISQFFKDKISIDDALGMLRRGDHIAVLRARAFIGRYTHHGIYGGDARVVEYGSKDLFEKGHVRLISLEEFIGDSGLLMRVDSEKIYSANQVLRRALSRFGEQKYNLLTNNCEHFARWCRAGD